VVGRILDIREVAVNSLKLMFGMLFIKRQERIKVLASDALPVGPGLKLMCIYSF